jgi:purine-cytosine permease-like protein
MPPFAAMGGSSHTEAKPIFANPVRGFANRVAALPGLALYPASAAATVLIATLVGAFGTGAMPLLQRLAFWTLLIAFHTMLWVSGSHGESGNQKTGGRQF